jgi:tetratricopeptide (TPR) repeat protein
MKSPFPIFLLVLLLAVLVFPAKAQSRASPQLADSPASSPQTLKAAALFEQLYETEEQDTETTADLLRQVIRLCPDTPYAEIAHWKYSNLLLFERESVDFQAIIDLLKGFPARYPSSPLIPDVTLRLLRAYRETEQYPQAISLLEGIVKTLPPDSPDRTGLGIQLSELYALVGNTKAARETAAMLTTTSEQNPFLKAVIRAKREEAVTPPEK